MFAINMKAIEAGVMKRGAGEEDSEKDEFVRVRKRDLEKLSTEVMQLRELLPKVVNGDLTKSLLKARSLESRMERSGQEQEHLRKVCQHLKARLDAAQSEGQREKEEKLQVMEQVCVCVQEKLQVMEQVCVCREQLQQQAEFCTALGAGAGTLLWSASRRENAVRDMLADGKLEPFLSIAGQTLESFVKSLDDEAKPQHQDYNSHEHQFVLAMAGIITNLAAVTCGRDFLSSHAPVLLDTLMLLLGLMKPGVFPKLKVLMLMALYNISISVRGLKYISESPGLLPLLRRLLEDSDVEVCLHALRLLQSLLLEAEPPGGATEDGLSALPLARIRRLARSRHAALRQTAQETLDNVTAALANQGPTASDDATPLC